MPLAKFGIFWSRLENVTFNLLKMLIKREELLTSTDFSNANPIQINLSVNLMPFCFTFQAVSAILCKVMLVRTLKL